MSLKYSLSSDNLSEKIKNLNQFKSAPTSPRHINKIKSGLVPNPKHKINSKQDGDTKQNVKNEDKTRRPKHEDKEIMGDMLQEIPLELKKQGNAINCSDIFIESNCPCNTMDITPKRHTPVKTTLDKRSLIPIDRLNDLRKKVQEAIKMHKVFTIRGCFYSIRKSLVQRGWVEKLDIHRKTIPNLQSNFMIEDLVQQLPARRPGESRRQHIAKCERNLMSRMLEYVAVDFLWTCRKEKSDWLDMARNPTLVINKFNKVPYTTKEGLCNVLRDFHWFYEEGTAELYFPRCYNVWNPEELTEFIDNFRITACISALRWLVENSKQKGLDIISSLMGKVPSTCISFAITRCTEFINSAQHYDIDSEDVGIKIWEHDWEVFYTHLFMLTHENQMIQVSTTPIESLVSSAEKMLHDVKQYWPQYNLDGYLNIWIVKPGNRCRGRGIHVMNNLKNILNLVNPQIVSKTRYVIQKYIERPLIIHNTKFDIRQWFMVTSVQPLVVWMYKESYLRFSSQNYDLKTYHESVHLTNHAIQKKYTNCVRDERLPQENMWDCHTFQAYLRQIGQMKMWNERIYPGMQKAIVGTMLASQEHMDRRPHSYELFGADFMISEDFYPWLIEINASPDLNASTSVTARLCPQCLEDIIKVVIDRKTNPNVDTGSFEMIYKQIIPPAPAYMGLNLFLKGQQILPKTTRKEKHRDENRPPKINRVTAKSHTPPSANTTGPVIVDFMECLNMRAKHGTEELSKAINGGIVLKKSNLSTHKLSNTKIINTKYLHIRSSISKLPSTKTNANGDKNVRSEFLRRHASCGRKNHSITNLSTQPATEENLVSPKNSEVLECVGNKCLEKIEQIQPITDTPWDHQQNNNNNIRNTYNSVTSLSSSSSSLSCKPSVENLYKSKSATSLNGHLKNLRKLKNYKMNVNNHNNFRRLVPQNSLNNLHDVNTKNLKTHYSTNFFAVGLSLRAWRAKYSKISKIQEAKQKEQNNLNIKTSTIVQSWPSPLSSPANLGADRPIRNGFLKGGGRKSFVESTQNNSIYRASKSAAVSQARIY